MAAAAPPAAAGFAEREDAAMNQYWYSPATIDRLVSEIELQGTKVAFLSTPSLYFSLRNATTKSNSKVFEFDTRWADDAGFVFYDFNKPEAVPVGCWDAFDMIVVDPPFITKEVWSKYIQTVKLIAKKGCKFLFTSVIENHEMLEELIDDPMYVAGFQPSIPHLTYQYHCFVNYPLSGFLAQPNPELPAEDAKTRAARSMANDLRESEVAFTQQMKTRERAGEEVLPALARTRKRQAELAAAASAANGGAVPAAASGAPPAVNRTIAPPADEIPISQMKWSYIPAGLSEYAPEGSEAAASSAPKSAAYEALALRRNLMEEYKKLIDEVVRQVTKMITFRETNGGAAAVLPDEIRAPRDASVARIRAIADELAVLDALDASSVCRVMRSGADAYATADSMTAAQFREMCADATRLYKSPVFNRQKELLAQMKLETKKSSAAPAAGAATASSESPVAAAAPAS